MGGNEERGNLLFHGKGKARKLEEVSVKVPMGRAEAEQPVVARKLPIKEWSEGAVLLS